MAKARAATKQDRVGAQLAALEAARRTNEDAAITALESLADDLSDGRVRNLLLEVIADPETEEMVRIETLKILQLWRPPDARIRTQTGRAIAALVAEEPSTLVRQWAALAAEGYVDVPAVFTALAAAVVDAAPDLDFRFNCLAALRRSADKKKLAPILRSLAADARFAPTVARIRDAERKKPVE